jgi:cysteine-rich repeat protein
MTSFHSTPDIRRAGILPLLVLLVAWAADGQAAHRRAVCGNGLVQSGEECDDGNIEPGDMCSPTCSLEIPTGCTLISQEDYENVWAFDAYYHAMLARARDLGYSTASLNSPARCVDSAGEEIYSANLTKPSAPQEFILIRSQVSAPEAFRTLLYELSESRVKVHFPDGTLLAEGIGTGNETFTLLGLDGNVLNVVPTAAMMATSSTCDALFQDFTQCFMSAVATNMILAVACVAEGATLALACAEITAGLAVPACLGVFWIATEQALNGPCSQFLGAVDPCGYPAGEPCEGGPPQGCHEPKTCQFRAANPFRGMECECPLRITQFNDPVIAVVNGDDADVEISWDGTPEFPVTASHKTPSCPRLWWCHADTRYFDRSRNPLVWRDELGCSIGGPGPYGGLLPQSFGTEFALTDASGLMSAPAMLTWTCVEE